MKLALDLSLVGLAIMLVAGVTSWSSVGAATRRAKGFGLAAVGMAFAAGIGVLIHIPGFIPEGPELSAQVVTAMEEEGLDGEAARRRVDEKGSAPYQLDVGKGYLLLWDGDEHRLVKLIPTDADGGTP